MQESDLSYRFYFENLPAMVHSTDSDARLVAVSNIWLEKTGYRRDEVLGKFILDFAPPDFRSFFERLRDELARDGFYNASYDMLCKDGSRIQLRASSVMAKGPVSGQRFSLTVLQDIGEERRLQSEVQKQQIALISAARMASLGEMASGIAHEINNPLTIIHGKASQIRRFLQKAALDLPPVEEMLQTIEKTSMRIATITRSLRTFAREGSETKAICVPLATVVDETLLLCQAMFRNHQIDLKVGSVPKDLKIECRPADLSEALFNILKNAFESVSKAINEKTVQNPWMSIEFAENLGRARILIKNNGAPIPEDIRDRIMDPFFTTKMVGDGVGLGLSVAKGLVESQGGSLFLDEAANLTTFVIEVPLAGTFR